MTSGANRLSSFGTPQTDCGPLDLLHIAKTSIMTAMKHGDLMARIAQLPHKR